MLPGFPILIIGKTGNQQINVDLVNEYMWVGKHIDGAFTG